MSGGVSYVLDLDPGRVNTDMVDLEPLEPGSGDALHELIVQHLEETESPVAEKLLADWPSSADRFTRVMPRDYRAVLEARDAAERAGLSEAEATAMMMEAAHG
jgi:glutamate synthase (NADPH/NADH) large chain